MFGGHVVRIRSNFLKLQMEEDLQTELPMMEALVCEAESSGPAVRFKNIRLCTTTSNEAGSLQHLNRTTHLHPCAS
jgi:hypothetical protein